MHRAWWMFVIGVLACGTGDDARPRQRIDQTAASRTDGHPEAAGASLRTAGARTLGRQAGAPDGGRRLALVVGNDEYPAPLQNAVNDARAVAVALADVGFTVTRVENASRARMADAIETFAEDLSGDDVALFYFAGHGVQVGESPENYLIPTDFDGRTESAVRMNAVKAADVVGELRRARVAMAVFDACRDNPYRGTRGGGGLAAMEARGTLIAYAADAGQLASDNPEGQNGLFTQHFVAALREPGLTATALFQRVRRGVVAASRERQWPAVYDSLLADFVFRAPVVPVVTETELEDWRNAQATDTAEAYRSYERQYPNGRFVESSRLRRAELGDVAGGGPVVGTPGPAYVAGEVFRDCDTCPELVVVSAGTFQMGSQDSAVHGSGTTPVHPVEIRSFAVGRRRVTFSDYKEFADSTGLPARACSNSVDGVALACASWNDADAYMAWLSQEKGQQYRLLSEAEWEYVSLEASRHGVADMAQGETWEWVEDCWHDSYEGAPSDGSAWISNGLCRFRVRRGGTHSTRAREFQAAVLRNDGSFRVARTLDSPR